jgi:hypothetical protein
LKNNKAPGTDLIQTELMKHAGAEYIKHLHQFITKIWITETIPEKWNMSNLCPIHKKGDITICSNYIGISLLNITYKILSNILFTALSPYGECYWRLSKWISTRKIHCCSDFHCATDIRKMQ